MGCMQGWRIAGALARMRGAVAAALLFAAMPAAQAVPTIRILDTDRVSPTGIKLLLPDGSNSGVVPQLRRDGSDRPYDFIEYLYLLDVALKPVPPGAPSANSREYHVTEPRSGTAPGLWSETVGIAWLVDSAGHDGGVAGKSAVLITVYSDHGPHDRPFADDPGAGSLGVFAGTFEANHVFEVSQDFDVDGTVFLRVSVEAVPEPASGWLAVAALGAVCVRRYRARPRAAGGA
ncbi:MAG: hypothetical protein JNM90_06155 [Burkholderiales bacterium]|nr:hypothetical protein [Burkholderiales bacterium]